MTQRGATLLELLVVAAILLAIATAFAVPGYRSYAASRSAADAAATLAEDLEFLSRTAQNGTPNEGASLVVLSGNPLMYASYLGRPESVDPHSSLIKLLVQRHFPGVELAGGPIDTTTPLLFASNGSAQYVSGGAIASQHQTIDLVLTAVGGRSAKVEVNLFTGAVTRM